MAAKYLLLLCATACCIQINLAQCLNAALAEERALAGNALAYGAIGAYGAAPYGYPYPGCGLNVAPTSGGGFAVTSSSPISPTGISVISENAIEGPLTITGQLPFLGAIALEGALPSGGAGAINYGCGSGAVGIVSEGVAPVGPAYGGYGPAGLAGGLAYPGLAGPRAFNGLAGGLGCGALY